MDSYQRNSLLVLHFPWAWTFPITISKGKYQRKLANSKNTVLLNFSNNLFTGGVPGSFSSLLSIHYINLSRNNLSGNVPVFLGHLTMLEELDLSYNNFEGEILASGIFLNSTVVHLYGNKRLCSNFFMLALPPCFTDASLLLLFCLFTLRNKMVHTPPLLSLVWNFLCFLTLGRRRETEIFQSYQETLKKVSYGDIAKATKLFSPARRISSTCTGSVYVGRFKFDSDLVAIKVFNLNEPGVHKIYFTECEVLRSIRHRNILKYATLCSSLDKENNEFKALVFEFMVNGSLERWLHPEKQTGKPKRTLSLGQRICIATDVASAMDYLHNQSMPPLVHCDLKPGNVLLDYDMTARVGDFGSAKFLSHDSGGLKHLVSIQGTVGYLAPEYGMGSAITRQGDVYSFGVLLLEMLTGKRPTDEMLSTDLTFTILRTPCSQIEWKIFWILRWHMGKTTDCVVKHGCRATLSHWLLLDCHVPWNLSKIGLECTMCVKNSTLSRSLFSSLVFNA
ncbi:hypothetical protein HU200_014480 [Digitaria exilis]|uniref:non-specific serine/threonine protein kinase n=1 Tax=Digitaria exilis TaxID=1010633 RepID=A0A835FBX2_9POAL|nr:hypothetical protein HU200_014480 [Digitaria exilis]